MPATPGDRGWLGYAARRRWSLHHLPRQLIKGWHILHFGGDGMGIEDGTQDNTIDGDGAGERNLNSANGQLTVQPRDRGTDQWEWKEEPPWPKTC
jgi:hypothetical protein